MSRWHRIGTIATFEFLSTVKRPGYLITTLGMPLFLAFYAGIVAVPAYFMGQQAREPAVYGIVDPAAVLGLRSETSVGVGSVPEDLRRALEAAGQQSALDRIAGLSRIGFRPFATDADARQALHAQRIKGYFVLPADYLQRGDTESYTSDGFRFPANDARNALSSLIRQHLLAGKVDGAIAARVLNPVGNMRQFGLKPTGEVVGGDGRSNALRLVVPITFMVLFLLSVLMTSGYLMQGTATEKENKVVDVLLASASPDVILGGKLLGLGGAGLLQIVLWLLLVAIGGVGILPLLMSVPADVPWRAMAMAIPLFVVSFLFFGSLMLGSGSLGANMREAQQLAMVWSLTAALPFMVMALLLQEPHGTVARVLTFVPFTSAAVVVLRASLDPASLAWWEIAGAFLVLTGSMWLAIRVGARLFRIGLLISGARPSLREILRQARL